MRHTVMFHVFLNQGSGVVLRGRFWIGAAMRPYGALGTLGERVLNNRPVRRAIIPAGVSRRSRTTVPRSTPTSRRCSPICIGASRSPPERHRPSRDAHAPAARVTAGCGGADMARCELAEDRAAQLRARRLDKTRALRRRRSVGATRACGSSARAARPGAARRGPRTLARPVSRARSGLLHDHQAVPGRVTEPEHRGYRVAQP